MKSAPAFYFLLHEAMSNTKYSWRREYLKLTASKLSRVVEYEDKTMYQPASPKLGLPWGVVPSNRAEYAAALLRFRKDAAERRQQAEVEKEARKLADKKLNGIRGLGPAPQPHPMRVATTPALVPSTALFDDFTIVDTEYQGEHLLEVAAIRYKNWQEVDRYVSFVRFTQWIFPLISEKTGITESDVNRAPLESKVLQAFLTLAGDSLLIAHNIGADRSKFEAACKRQGMPMLTNKWFCTLALARARRPKGAKCGLTELCDLFKFGNQGAHRALSDVERTYKVLRHFHQEQPLLSLDPKAKAAAQSNLFAA
jgi:DNA polymerase III epsilon subunit-like protein